MTPQFNFCRVYVIFLTLYGHTCTIYNQEILTKKFKQSHDSNVVNYASTDDKSFSEKELCFNHATLFIKPGHLNTKGVLYQRMLGLALLKKLFFLLIFFTLYPEVFGIVHYMYGILWILINNLK